MSTTPEEDRDVGTAGGAGDPPVRTPGSGGSPQDRLDHRYLAGLLWAFGEDDLWPRALTLDAAASTELSCAAARWYRDRAGVEARWPGAPWQAYILLPAVELLTGDPRPPRRRTPRSAVDLPREIA